MGLGIQWIRKSSLKENYVEDEDTSGEDWEPKERQEELRDGKKTGMLGRLTKP